STAYHNTVRVDGLDISQASERELFAFVSNVRPKVNRWESDGDRDVLDAEHDAYERLAAPITHRRIVTLDKRERCWIIQDIFTGQGHHKFEFFFNFDDGLEAQIKSDLSVVVQDRRSALAIVPASGHAFETELVERWVSRAYGTRVRSSAIMYRFNGEVPFENLMLIIPYRVGEIEKVVPIRRWRNLSLKQLQSLD